jgi:hypothetical protein
MDNAFEFNSLKTTLLDSIPDSERLFAILDGARDPEIKARHLRLNLPFVSLYRGEPEETLGGVGPLLVCVDTTDLVTWLLRDGWGKSWGIFFTANVSLEDLRRHFRHFLLVRDPDGQELYFRFYDPRVLRVYLPTCTARETIQFLGPVSACLMESEDGSAIHECTVDGVATIPLASIGQTSRTVRRPPGAKYRRPHSRIKIREEQMTAFSTYMRRSFETRAQEHLRSTFAEAAAMPDDQLCSLVENAIDAASVYELSAESDVIVFLELELLYARKDGPTQFIWAKSVIGDTRASVEDKAARLRIARDRMDEEASKENG